MFRPPLFWWPEIWYRLDLWEGGLFLGYYLASTTYLTLAATRHSVLPLFSTAMLCFVMPLTVVALAVVTVRGRRFARRPA